MGNAERQALSAKETVALFTEYHSSISRRGYGSDKPEKDNHIRPDPIPAIPLRHHIRSYRFYRYLCLGDPLYNIVFVFLSNRVNPQGGDNTKLLRMNAHQYPGSDL